jgi:nitrogen fixation protein FixH
MKTTPNLWPYGILAAFVLFFGGIVAVIFIAVTHHESLVSDNYYDQEIDYQKRIDGTVRAEESGASIAYNAATAQVVIGIPAAQRAQRCTGRIDFYRPSSSDLDCEFPLESNPAAPQTIDASKLAAGLWKVSANWRAGGEDYHLDQRIVIAEK